MDRKFNATFQTVLKATVLSILLTVLHESSVSTNSRVVGELWWIDTQHG